MAKLYESLTTPAPRYFDRKFNGTEQEYFNKLDQSTTIYVGNLSFYTSEEQVYELFSSVGDVKLIIMGLDRVTKTPCGFCFVEYYDRFAAENCMRYINGTTLDERIVRTDWDPGFSGDRQFGRGRSGGQVRDEYRSEYDSGRGGYGRQYQRQTPTAYTEFQSAPSISGTKRSLDDPSSSQASKNPRFREREDNDD